MNYIHFPAFNHFLNPHDYWTFKDITAQVVSIVEIQNHGISVFFFDHNVGIIKK